jgi:hypothetical protein
MTPENFCYFLQGMLESDKVKTLDEADVQMIKDHLKLVFNKVTPNIGTLTPTTPIPFSPNPNLFKPICSTTGLVMDHSDFEYGRGYYSLSELKLGGLDLSQDPPQQILSKEDKNG